MNELREIELREILVRWSNEERSRIKDAGKGGDLAAWQSATAAYNAYQNVLFWLNTWRQERGMTK